jgi:hypothetical protein
MLAGGGVLLVLAQNDIHDVEHPRANTRWSDVSDAYDTSPLKSGIGFALLGVGAMGVTAGLIWALGGDDREHARAGHVQLAVGPRHAVLRGAF